MSAPLLTINQIVDQYCLASGDHDRKNYLVNQVNAKWVIRDLHLNLMPNPKRVFLRVNPKNNTAMIPLDYYKQGSVGIVDDCNQIIPLSFNEYINTVVDTTDADCKKENDCCDCKGKSEICDEVSKFETITETVQVPTAIGSKCDYEFSFGGVANQCYWTIDFSAVHPVIVTINGIDYNIGNYGSTTVVAMIAFLNSLGLGIWSYVTYTGIYTFYVSGYETYTTFNYNGTPYSPDQCGYDSNIIVNYILNGHTVPVAMGLNGQPAWDFFFESLGWTKISDTKYVILQTTDVWGCFLFSIGIFGSGTLICATSSNCSEVFEDVEHTNTTNIKTCANGDVIKESCLWTQVHSPYKIADYTVLFPDETTYPFTIVKYRKNGTDYTVNHVVTGITELISYLSTLGFSHLISFQFVNTDSSDVWESFTLEGDLVLDVESRDEQTKGTTTVEKICKTEVLCNVPVKPCGCIIPTPETEQILATACGCLLQSCCKMFCPTPTPQVANGYGSCNIDERTNLIYIESPYKVEKIVLSYFTDGNIGGVMYIPEFCLDAVMRGIKARESAFNRRLAQFAKQDGLDYEQAKAALHDYNFPMRIDEVRRALKLFYQN